MKKVIFGKRIALIVFFCVVFLAFCSCGMNSEQYNVDGIENFETGESSVELNYQILPSEDFLEDFEYTNADYHYRYGGFWLLIGFSEECSLISVQYEKEEYKEAKSYCLQNMQLVDDFCLEHNGYTFLLNTQQLDRFPSWFNMVAYNDSLNCLVFMGFYDDYDYSTDDSQSVQSNWSEFLEKHFSDIYDWSADNG